MNIRKIAVISYHTCPLSDENDAEIGGMNTYVLELSKALTEKGYVIDIYTRCADQDSPNIVNVSSNLRVIHLPTGNPTAISKKELPQFIPEFTANLKKFIMKEKISYELISAHYYLSGLIGLEIKKRLRIPLVVTFHTLAFMKNLVAKNEDEREGLARVKAELLLTQKADQLIATSEADLEYIHTLYNCPLKKLSVLTPGVDLKLFKPINKSIAKKTTRANLNHRIILFVGRIEALKGIDMLLYAIKILIEKNKKLPICLWIVGGNTDQQKEYKKLEEIRKLLKIRSYVRFIGKKTNQELPFYYNCAEIVLMPSHYESFGIAALEAMACGIPVITTDVAGISGLLDKEHSFLLTSAGNPIRMARKINHLLTNKEEYREMSNKLLSTVRDLSWENIADKFTQILSTF
ncbi:glycosyltransferase [Patescibacteria group bacterium]|nr:glycosyltransferase [Patescibacteria group bacterium]